MQGMRSSVTLALFLSALVTLGITHALATEFALYWKYVWLDIPMHVLGGLTVALGLFALPLISTRVRERSLTFIPVLGMVLAVGVIWEVFEISIGMPQFEEGFYIDMVGDLTMDLIGAALAYALRSNLSKL